MAKSSSLCPSRGSHRKLLSDSTSLQLNRTIEACWENENMRCHCSFVGVLKLAGCWFPWQLAEMYFFFWRVVYGERDFYFVRDNRDIAPKVLSLKCRLFVGEFWSFDLDLIGRFGYHSVYRSVHHAVPTWSWVTFNITMFLLIKR